MQRFFDIMLSCIPLFLLLPIFIPVILALRFTGEREIFYTQERVGKDGKTFGLLKFATMLRDSPNLGTGTITLQNDPRILPFGGVLRKTKFNELPQLINVLKGNMSLIGPRPLTKDRFCEYDCYTQKEVSRVRPGLSGVGSIVFRSEEKLLKDPTQSETIYREIIAPFKGELEMWYVGHRSIKMYFILIIVTILVTVAPSRINLWKFYPLAPKPSNKLSDMLKL
jgi:lipopolysaccharide/colanic/teichoic acid biosynthesis glycosyltransferase